MDWVEGAIFIQPSSVHGWTSACLFDVHMLCGAIERRLSHFLPRWLRTGRQSAVGPGIEPGSQRGQTVRFIHFTTEL